MDTSNLVIWIGHERKEEKKKRSEHTSFTPLLPLKICLHFCVAAHTYLLGGFDTRSNSLPVLSLN